MLPWQPQLIRVRSVRGYFEVVNVGDPLQSIRKPESLGLSTTDVAAPCPVPEAGTFLTLMFLSTQIFLRVHRVHAFADFKMKLRIDYTTTGANPRNGLAHATF